MKIKRDSDFSVMVTFPSVRLASEFERKLKASQWQPIETAPKDGTEVLCWREDCGSIIASFTSADALPLSQSEIDELDEESLFAKDWITQWPQALRLDGSEAPTHWQPLPAAPEKENG